MEEFIKYLQQKEIAYLLNEPLARYTTWKVGGPADIFIEIKESGLIQELIREINRSKLPYYILGGGSNVLISDQGFKGVVLKNSLSGIDIISEDQTQPLITREDVTDIRLAQHDKEEYYSFEELDYDESDKSKVRVSVLSGTLLSFAINNLISNGITGLQWFAGIPGTIGGAVFNNIHGGTHFISEYVNGADVINDSGEVEHYSFSDLGFGYDHSKLQLERKFILKIYFDLYKGDKQKAQETAIAWARAKKRKQPYNSAGCSFKNATKSEMEALKFPSNSWGYIIDKILNLKGTKIGGAMISNEHAAFIETSEGACAEDVISLLELVYDNAKEKIQVTPKTEIFFVGFPKERIEKFL